jgi:hypothetical protein
MSTANWHQEESGIIMDSEPGKIHQIHLNDIVWSGMMPAASDLHHNVSNCRLGVAWAQMQDLAKWIVPTLQYKGCWTWQIFPGLVMFSLLASACRAWLSDPLCENRKPHCPLSIITRPYIILGHIGYNSYILRPYLTFSESPRFPDEYGAPRENSLGIFWKLSSKITFCLRTA